MEHIRRQPISTYQETASDQYNHETLNGTTPSSEFRQKAIAKWIEVVRDVDLLQSDHKCLCEQYSLPLDGMNPETVEACSTKVKK